MRRLVLFLTIIGVFVLPSFAQGHATCVTNPEDATLELVNEWFLWENWEEFLNDGVLDYLNTTDSTDGLTASIEVDEPEIITSNVYFADVDSNGIEDILLLTILDFGGGYNYQMAVYTCVDTEYELLGDFGFGDFGYGATVEIIADTNGNNIPEIIMRPTYTPRKYYEALYFYEWNGELFELIFNTYWEYGGYGDVYFTNFDDDPTNIEMLIERLYSYGEATAMAYIELWLRRPVNMVFRWNADTYEQVCEYFTDTPTVLYHMLHSAEAYRQCGLYDDAFDSYIHIIDDYWNGETGEYILEGTDGSYALDPDVAATYDTLQSERDYLTAFAYYRIIQIKLHQNDYDAEGSALDSLTRMQELFPSGEQGYRYTAMAEAFYEEFVASHDMNAACDAATVAFDTVRDTDADPPIPYYDYGGWFYPFYWNSGKAYSADPDNLFAVPEDIANIISIPVCLQ